MAAGKPAKPQAAERRAALAFLAPAAVILLLFLLLPIAASLFLSFSDFDLYALADPAEARFVGLQNYLRLLSQPLFWRALANTLFFVLVGGPLSVSVSLAAALLIEARLTRARPFFRTVFFAPVVTTLVAVAIVWRYLFHTQYGLFNYMLGLVGLGPIDWLGDPRWAMPAIILLAVWKNFGFNMLIFIAGLQAIPTQLYDAARVDGAGVWQQFTRITLPLLAPTFLFVGLTTMIGYFQLFAEPYVMTRGGPQQSTYSVILYMYEEGFRWWNLGFAASIAFVLFLIVLMATVLQLYLGRASTRSARNELVEPRRATL